MASHEQWRAPGARHEGKRWRKEGQRRRLTSKSREGREETNWCRLTRACSARREEYSRVNDKRRLAGVTILVNKGGQNTAYSQGFTPIPANQLAWCV